MDNFRNIGKLTLKDIRGKNIENLFSVILLAFLATCEPQSNIKYEITNCDDPRRLDLKLGDKVDVINVGDGEFDFYIDQSGLPKIPKISERIIDPSNDSYLLIGNPKEKHYEVHPIPDSDGDVIIKKVCPTPPTTPTPNHLKPTSLRGTGKYASMPPGFHPATNNSKPAIFNKSVFIFK